jgi:hypothetical protein
MRTSAVYHRHFSEPVIAGFPIVRCRFPGKHRHRLGQGAPHACARCRRPIMWEAPLCFDCGRRGPRPVRLRD